MIREGETAEEIVKLIDEDADIGILVLAAGSGEEGPGPLVAGLAKTAATFPIPVAIVPGQLQRRGPRYDGFAHVSWPFPRLNAAPAAPIYANRRKPAGLEPAGMRRKRCSSRPKQRPIRRR